MISSTWAASSGQIRRLQAGGQLIQFAEPGFHPGDHAGFFKQFFNGIETAFNDLLDAEKGPLGPFLGYLEDGTFRLVKNFVGIVRIFVTAGDNFGGSFNQIPQNLFLADDFGMMGNGGGSGHQPLEKVEIIHAADIVQLAIFPETVSDGEDIDGLVGLKQKLHGGKNFPVAGFVEIIPFDDFQSARKSIAGSETGTQHILLRLFIVGRKFSQRDVGDVRHATL